MASDAGREPATSANDVAMGAAVLRSAPVAGDVIRLAPNVVSVRHWDRLLGGLLYAATPTVDWATLLRFASRKRVLRGAWMTRAA